MCPPSSASMDHLALAGTACSWPAGDREAADALGAELRAAGSAAVAARAPDLERSPPRRRSAGARRGLVLGAAEAVRARCSTRSGSTPVRPSSPSRTSPGEGRLGNGGLAHLRLLLEHRAMRARAGRARGDRGQPGARRLPRHGDGAPGRAATGSRWPRSTATTTRRSTRSASARSPPGSARALGLADRDGPRRAPRRAAARPRQDRDPRLHPAQARAGSRREEFEVVKTHAVLGARVLADSALGASSRSPSRSSAPTTSAGTAAAIPTACAGDAIPRRGAARPRRRRLRRAGPRAALQGGVDRRGRPRPRSAPARARSSIRTVVEAFVALGPRPGRPAPSPSDATRRSSFRGSAAMTLEDETDAHGSQAQRLPSRSRHAARRRAAPARWPTAGPAAPTPTPDVRRGHRRAPRRARSRRPRTGRASSCPGRPADLGDHEQPAEPRRASAARRVVRQRRSSPPDDGRPPAVARRHLCLLNAERVDRGLPALKPRTRASPPPRSRTRRTWSTAGTSPTRPRRLRLRRAHARHRLHPDGGAWAIGENLAWGTGDARQPAAIMRRLDELARPPRQHAPAPATARSASA